VVCQGVLQIFQDGAGGSGELKYKFQAQDRRNREKNCSGIIISSRTATRALTLLTFQVLVLVVAAGSASVKLAPD